METADSCTFVGIFSRVLSVLLAIVCVLSPLNSFAFNEAPQTFTLDGQLFEGGSTSPLLDANLVMKVQIINPAGTCILYEEQQTLNTFTTNGYFTVNVGSATGSAKRTVNDPGRTMAQVFQNLTAITANSVPGQTCTGGAYSPNSGAVRYFRVIITPSATNVADTLSPDIVIDSVPHAIVAQSLEGLERANILQFNTTAPVALNQANLEALFTTPAYTNLQSILAGNFMRQDNSGASLPSYAATPGGVATGDIWYDTTTNEVKFQSNSGVQTVGTSAGGISSLTMSTDLSVNGVVAGTISNGSATIGIATITSPGKVSGNAITSGTISGSTGISTTGNLVTTAAISGLSVQASNIKIYNGTKYLQMQASSMSSDVTLTWPATAGTAGQVLSTDGTGNLSWIATSVIGGILNGGNSFAADMTVGTNDNNALKFEVNNSTAMTISQNSRVGIGTTSPRGTLDVSGTVLSKAATVNATGTIDMSSGNIQYTNSSCGSFAFHHMKDGGTYMFVVKGTSVATCSFTAFSDAGSTALTVHLPPDHGATTTAKHTIYNLTVVGSDVYVAWTPGY
jgi:hypothetical protein